MKKILLLLAFFVFSANTFASNYYFSEISKPKVTAAFQNQISDGKKVNSFKLPFYLRYYYYSFVTTCGTVYSSNFPSQLSDSQLLYYWDAFEATCDPSNQMD